MTAASVKDGDSEKPGVQLTMVITLRNGVQIRAGVKTVDIGQNTVTGGLKSLNWILDDDPHGSSIGWVDVGEIVAVHYERGPAVQRLSRPQTRAR